MMALLCGSYYLLILISRASECIKKYRRSSYVKQIKTHHFKAALVSCRLLMDRKNVDPENRPMCSICLSEFEDGQTVKTLRCGHSFHPECIDTWLVNERALCPVCRQGIYQVEDWVEEMSSVDRRTSSRKARVGRSISFYRKSVGVNQGIKRQNNAACGHWITYSAT